MAFINGPLRLDWRLFKYCLMYFLCFLGKKVAVMSKRKQAVLAHKIAFWISLYLFITSRVSEAIKICKESLLLINHKALVNEIEFVSVVRLLADPLMAFGYMYLEDTLSFAKHLLHLCLISPGRTFKTIFKPSRLQELYKRQCKYDKAQALWMETGEKEEEYLDEVFPSFFDEISPEECQFASATVHEMGTLPRECLSGKSLIRQACSSLVKSNNLLKETLSMLEFFDKEKAQHPHHYKCLLDKIYFHDYSMKYLKQELKSLTKRGRAASIHQCRVYGKSWVLLGDYSEAKANFEKALAISIEQRDRKEEAAGYGLLGAVFQYLRRYNEAEKNLEKQVAIYKEIGDIHGQARSYENLGTLYRFLDDTVKAKEYFRKALEIAKKTGHREIETSCCKKLGDVYASLGNPDSAKKFADKAFLLNKETGNDNVLFLMMKSLFKDETGSQLFANLQRLDFEFTRGYDDEITSLFSDQGFLGHKMMSFAFCCLGNHHAGLCLAELARARALADFLSVQYSVEMKRSLDYFNPQKRIGMERILKTERNCCCLYISYFSQFISVWLLKADHPLRFQGIKVSDFFAKSLSNDADASCRKIDRNKHHLTPEQDKDQSLFPSQYFQENNLPFSRLIEEDDDEEVQRTTLAPADYYNTTIAPVVDFLDEPEIIIFPDRVFSRLPFAALKDKRGKYLSETFRIRIAPSLTTLKMIQDSPADYHSQTGALIVGDPDVGRVLYKEISCQIPRLPDASKEAKMIGRLLGVQPLLGKQATKKQILQSINSVSLIHFAAHGDDKRGEIFLAPPPMLNRTPQEEDYLLTMQEILQVRVRAKLVVLSCCHSANGKIRQEGVVGIGRAFLASGARSVLVALWAIEDKATYQLMIRFYEHLVRGESASESLHQAMKWMRENGYSKVGQWAPFMLIGDNVSFDFQRIR